MSRTSSNLNLHILVPGLLGKLVARSLGARSFPRFTHIESLLSRSRRRKTEFFDYESQLCALFGLRIPSGQELPLGSIRRYGITGAIDETYLLCADPVHLRADLQQVLLMDSIHLDLASEETKLLTELFNSHFESEDLCLVADDTRHWHLRLNRPESIRTPSLRQVRGGDISGFLPKGECGTYWRGLINEVQMLYHGAETNQRRNEHGKLAINSLWLFGAGTIPVFDVESWTAVWAADPLVTGLTHLADADLYPVPAGLNALLENHSGGKHLICLDDLAIASSYDDLPAWRESMQWLDRDWFKLLAAALKAGYVDEAILYDCAGQTFRLRGTDWWRLWRNPRPLNEMVLTG